MARRLETEIGPIDRDERLGEAMEAFLELAEGGSRPDPEAFAAGYPDLADDLVAALQGLALVQGLVGDTAGGPGHRLEAGRRVAGYRIVRELGRGGMGIVYEAVHVGLDRPVALKVLGTQAAPDSTGRRRFLNEARTAAGLHHTHIVPVFDVGQVGGLCYYAMQRIEGSGLDRVLRILRRDRSVAAGSTYGPTSPRAGSPAVATPGRLALAPEPSLGDETRSWAVDAPPAPWRKGSGPVEDDAPTFIPPRGGNYYRWVADVGRQAAEALAHAHHQGVIHRDIKPSNLLIDARGAVWVADFGLARRLADPSQTQIDSLLGTPRYMSPEQARTGAIDGRSDVYSLGATLYELVTMRPPFDGRSAAELIEQIAGQEPTPPRKFDPRIPLDLETILLKALAKRPDDRYASADDLADDLGRFLAHEPVRARRIGPIGRLWRFARRYPGISAVSAASAAAILTVATVAYVRIAAERDREVTAREAARAARREAESANGKLQQANGKLLRANAENTATMRNYLASYATTVRLSNVADRRSRGLELLRKAAELRPDPGQLVELRDQALAFLAMRDVEARPPITTPRPQQGLVFSPDGRRIAAIDDDGELNIWDVARRELADSSRGSVGLARRSSNGTPRSRGAGTKMAGLGASGQLAVIRPDGDGIRLFDAAAPAAPADVLAMPDRDVTSLLATPDGRRFLTVERPGPQDEPRVALWSRDDPGAPRATLALPEPKAEPVAGRWRGWLMVAIAPDGSTIAAARANDSQVALWDGNGRALAPIEVQANPSALALGPGGLLAIAGGDEVALWDLSPRRPLPGLVMQQGFVQHLRFSPADGALLAAAGPRGVELWDLATHATVAALLTQEWVEDLAFSPDGRTVAASLAAPASQRSSIALWTVVEPAAQVVLAESADQPMALAFGPDDSLAIASRDGPRSPAPLRVWERPDRSPTAIDSWDHVRAHAVAFDDQGLLIALETRRLSWLEAPDLIPLAEVEIPDRRGRPARGEGPPPEASPPPLDPGRPPGSGPPRGPEGMATIPPGRPYNPNLARSQDGRTLAFSRSGEVFVWRADAPDEVTRLDLPELSSAVIGWVNFLFALSPDGSRLYFVPQTGDKVVCRSLPGGPDAELEWRASLKEPTSLALAPDGRTLAVGEHGGAVALVDTARGEVRREFLPPQGDAPQPVESLAFAPDGKTLAVGVRDQVRLWAVDGPPTTLAHLPGPRGRVRALAFGAEGRRLAGADDNKSVRVWNLARLRAELSRLGLGW